MLCWVLRGEIGWCTWHCNPTTNPAQPELVEGQALDVEAGMEEMSKVFKEKGGEVYLPAG